MKRTLIAITVAAGMVLGVGYGRAAGQAKEAPAANKAIGADALAKAQADLKKGMDYLVAQRNPDGGWGFAPGKSHAALTAMVVKALVQHPDYGSGSDLVKKGVEVVMKYRQKDGGFYDPAEGNQNYVTSVVVMALAAVGDPAHKDALADAVKFLRGQQIAPDSTTPSGEKIDGKHPYVGGVSYGEHGRPDMSNLGFWVQAMHEAGVKGDDPAMQRALGFVTRMQNRAEGKEGETFTFKGPGDGGWIYAVTRKGNEFIGQSGAGSGPDGLRSYGSMTYTGFMSMLYANVDRNDPRIKAAYDWIRKYWRLDSNPNMPDAQSHEGLFYYYHAFAKALRAWGQDVITDAADVKHNWREELIGALHGRQKADGSWTNEKAERWEEGNPVLATTYCVLALEEAMK